MSCSSVLALLRKRCQKWMNPLLITIINPRVCETRGFEIGDEFVKRCLYGCLSHATRCVKKETDATNRSRIETIQPTDIKPVRDQTGPSTVPVDERHSSSINSIRIVDCILVKASWTFRVKGAMA